MTAGLHQSAFGSTDKINWFNKCQSFVRIRERCNEFFKGCIFINICHVNYGNVKTAMCNFNSDESNESSAQFDSRLWVSYIKRRYHISWLVKSHSSLIKSCVQHRSIKTKSYKYELMSELMNINDAPMKVCEPPAIYKSRIKESWAPSCTENLMGEMSGVVNDGTSSFRPCKVAEMAGQDANWAWTKRR